MSEKCCICEGTIVDGRCVDCGMPAAKSENAYHLNEDLSVHMDECMSEKERRAAEKKQSEWNSAQTVKSKTAAAGSSAANRQQKKAAAQTERQTAERQKQYTAYSQQTQKKTKKKGKKKTKAWIIAGVIIALLSEADSIYELIEDNIIDKLPTEFVSQFTKTEPLMEYYGIKDGVVQTEMYDYVSHALTLDGEVFEKKLYSGEYIGGCQLPEGTYTASTLGINRIQIEDPQNNIYLTYSMGGENEGTELSNIRIYEGAQVKINGDGAINFSTENAKTSSMQMPRENPNTEIYEFKEAAAYLAGQDFVPGVYDLEIIGGNCSVRVKDAGENTEYISFDETSGYGMPSIYLNVRLLEGYELEISYLYDENAFLKLIPSVEVYDPAVPANEVTYYEETEEEE